jgi:beta-lactamase superfamily II metal-dependent hydrolase
MKSLCSPVRQLTRRCLVFLSISQALWFISCAAYGQPSGNLQLHFIDVGQGDAALLVSPKGETVLFDDGVSKLCDRPKAYLDQLGIREIDYHVASHYHADHIGCCAEVFQAAPLKKQAFDRGSTYSSATFRSYTNAVGNKRKTVGDNETLTLDEGSEAPVTITFVAANGNGVETDNENDLSVVATIRFGSFRAEIGGDLSGEDTDSYRDIETSVAPEVGQIDVYKVHHHGSSHSSHVPWLLMTKPRVGIISCGNGNRYGHPRKDCLDRLHLAGVKTYWTELGNGAAPHPDFDKIGGTIIVDVPPAGSTYTVTYGGNKVDRYQTWFGAASAPAAGAAPASAYVWSIKSKYYHRPSCSYADAISPANLRTAATPPADKVPHSCLP